VKLSHIPGIKLLFLKRKKSIAFFDQFKIKQLTSQTERPMLT